MDAPPSRREATFTPPSLVQVSNVVFKQQSPVFKLPPELKMLIFKECRSFMGPPIILTHTCRRWWQIAVNDASLRTNICIRTEYPRQCFDHFLSFLGMQFDRTAGLLLDVEWAVLSVENTVGGPYQRTGRIFSVVVGRNLESLIIWDWHDDTIFGVVDRTITSCMKVLHLLSWEMDIMTIFAKSLTHISSLRFDTLAWNYYKSSPPANIANLQLDQGAERNHPFPHIWTYELQECIFLKDRSIDLRSMTTLTVRGCLSIYCPVSLPALRELKLESIRICDNGEIESPALDLLHFTEYNDGNNLLSFTGEALTEPGYLLSPKTSIIAGSYLPSMTLIKPLAKSPKITHATLQFNNWAGAQAVLERLVGLGAGTDSRFAENEILCRRLSELRLDFYWRHSELSASKEWLLHQLAAGRESGTLHSLSIYVGWKGEGTYVLLTGD